MTKRIAILILFGSLLTACGNKGVLVLPDKQPDSPSATHPATPEPGAQTSQE